MQLPVVAAVAAVAVVGAASVQPAAASGTPFFFTTGSPDGLIATATRPGSGAFEIESADDFILTGPTTITSATFTGLMPANSLPTNVVVEIYGVFPQLSNVGRTSGPPTFSTPQVPTRVNSPSDVALDSRDSSAPGDLTFTTSDLGPFAAGNSVQPGGIHPKPNQTTTGNGRVTGEEVQFNVTFTDPFSLAPGHYFFVPQVDLDVGNFLWLSAPKPNGAPDLQSWTRDQFLDPDWLRIGTDIVGAGAFNASFSLTGVIPEPGTLAILGTGLLGMAFLRRRAR
jgi:hypothetical protein